MRRNRIGTKTADLWGWEVEDIKKMTGPLAVQEYIQELISNNGNIQGMIPLQSIALLSALRKSISMYGNMSR